MLPQSHSSLHVTYAREPAFSLMLDELVQGAQVVKKFFFFLFSKLLDAGVLCAALVLGQENPAGRGSAGQALLAALFSCTHSQTGEDYSGLKTLQSFLSKFQPH